MELFRISKFGDWDDVPGIVSNDVGRDEIDLVRRILNHGSVIGAPSHGNAVSPPVRRENRFHLDAKHTAVPLDDHVVGFAVAVRLARRKPHADGFDHEDQFRHDAFAFGVACRASD